MSLTSGGSEFVSPDDRVRLMHEGVQRGADLANQAIEAIGEAVMKDGAPGTREHRLSTFRGACGEYIAGRLLVEDARRRITVGASTQEDLIGTLESCVDLILTTRVDEPQGEHEEPSRN